MKIWRNKEQPIAGFFDHGTNLTGELQFAGIVQIDGNFHGSIHGGDALIIGNNAVIHADIRVRDIEIHGQVFGNMDVSGRTVIHSTGSFRGDLRTPALVIHAGGILDGQSHMVAETEISGDPIRESTRAVPKELGARRRTFDKDTGPY